MNTRKEYRPEIDGLRALAVLVIIVSHVNENFLPGGFVGVDIFFVISGYVVTQSLLSLNASSPGEYIIQFYKKRIKRIIPALIFCVFISLLIGSLLIPRDSFLSYAVTAWSSLLAISNLQLYAAGQDYFAPESSLNPFTHTWSLGVEEQFYLIFPLICIFFLGFREKTAIKRIAFFTVVSFIAGALVTSSLKDQIVEYFSKAGLAIPFLPAIYLLTLTLKSTNRHAILNERNFIYVIFLLSLASFVICIWFTSRNVYLPFYYMPARFWEIALGAITYLLVIRRKHFEFNATLIKIIEIFGIAGIFLSIYSISGLSKFPYPLGLLPTLSTAICLYTSQSLGKQSIFVGLFSSKPQVFIGKISYSLYLWHMPILVFLRWTIGVENILSILLYIIVVGLFSCTSYYFVERQFRYSTVSYKAPILACGILTVLIISIANNKFMPETYIFKSMSGLIPRNHLVDYACHSGGPFTLNYLESCIPIRQEDNPVKAFLLIGDSHTLHHAPMIEKYCENSDCEVFVLTGSPLINNATHVSVDLTLLLNYLTNWLIPGDIIFHTMHRGYIYDFDVSGRAYATIQSDTNIDQKSITQKNELIYKETLKEIADFLSKRGANLILASDTPLLNNSAISACLIQSTIRNSSICDVNKEHSKRHAQPVSEIYRSVALQFENTYFWDLHDLFCEENKCSVKKGEYIQYFDAGHLSMEGSLSKSMFFAEYIDILFLY